MECVTVWSQITKSKWNYNQYYILGKWYYKLNKFGKYNENMCAIMMCDFCLIYIYEWIPNLSRNDHYSISSEY